MKVHNRIKMLIVILVAAFNLVVAYTVLADESPMFITITAKESCSTCRKLEPIIEDLQNEYLDRVTFVTLDVSSKDSLEEAKQIAEENGISKFFQENKGVVPKVGILCPGGMKTENIFIGETRKEVYEEALNKLLLDTTTLCSL